MLVWHLVLRPLSVCVTQGQSVRTRGLLLTTLRDQKILEFSGSDSVRMVAIPLNRLFLQ